MDFDQQITLLLVGAGIGLTSSLITSVVTTITTYWLARRSNRMAKREAIAKAFGRIQVRNLSAPGSETEVWEQIGNLAKLLDKAKVDEYQLDAIVGMLEQAIKIMESSRNIETDKASS